MLPDQRRHFGQGLVAGQADEEIRGDQLDLDLVARRNQRRKPRRQEMLRPVAQRDPDSLMIIDCLLPGQVRKLGSKLTYLTQPRPVRTTGVDCEIRGGEYVALDRASYADSLRVWLPLAEGGDPKAQTFVGEIFEKGLGVSPDYPSAVQW